MTRVLFIYPNASGYQRIPLGASIVITELMNKGMDVRLFDTTFFKNDNNIDAKLREKAGFVKKTEDNIKRYNLDDEEIEDMLLDNVTFFKPDYIFITIVEDNYRYANSLLKAIKEKFPKVPVIAGGTTPTVVPEIVCENPYINIILPGEFEGKIQSISPLQFKEQNKFVDMDEIPIHQLSIWDQRHFVKSYNGEIVKAGFIEMSRGCLNRCSYCVNAAYQDIFREYGKYHRCKSIDRLILEAKILKKLYGFEIFFFTDDDFLFMGIKRMEEFAFKWKQGIDLPYWINTRIEMITEGKLEYLYFSGCVGIGFGIESGSEELRKNILNRSESNEKIIEKFKMINAFGIRSTANFMLGFPYETERNIESSITLARQIKASSIDVTYVMPYYGTQIHKLCFEKGLIETETRPGFRFMVKDMSMRKEPVINNPNLSKERTIYYYDNFSRFVNE